jgi:amino acid transporter
VITLVPAVLLIGWSIPHTDAKYWIQNDGSTDWVLLVAMVLWMVSGFDDLGNMADVVDDPQRTYPKAMILSIVFIIASTLLSVMFAMCVDQNRANWVDGYFEQIAQMTAGPWLRYVLVLGACVGLWGNLLAQLLVTAEGLHYAALKGWAPHFLTAQRGAEGTQWVAIIVAGVDAMLFQLLPFAQMLEIHTLFYCGGNAQEHSAQAERTVMLTRCRVVMRCVCAVILVEMAAYVRLFIKYPKIHRPYRATSSLLWCVVLAAGPAAICLFNCYFASVEAQIIFGGYIALCVIAWIVLRLMGKCDEEWVNDNVNLKDEANGGAITGAGASSSVADSSVASSSANTSAVIGAGLPDAEHVIVQAPGGSTQPLLNPAARM